MPRALRAWAATWAVLLALLFVGVTGLTLAVWLSDPSYTATTPVSDLAFFALGATIAIGFASQVRTRTPGLAGTVQALIGAMTLAVAGLLGDRIEPLLGGVVLVVAGGILLVFHPGRQRLSMRPGRVGRLLAALSLAALLPAIWYAASMLELARDAGPSCFMGQCVTGDRYAEMAAVAVAIPILGLLAGLGLPGWRVPLWTAAAAALVVGTVSIALPDAPGSGGLSGGVAIVAWAVALPLLARVHEGETTMTGAALERWFGLRRTPGSITRFVFGLMPMLYRLRLGRLLGHQFLLIDHRGSKSGRRYVTALKVLAYDPVTGEAIVLSMYGPRAGWVRNLGAHPALRVRIAGSTYPPQQRFLTPDEAFAVAVRFRAEHPRQLRFFRTVLGWGDLASDADLRAFIEGKPFVAFAPAIAVTCSPA